MSNKPVSEMTKEEKIQELKRLEEKIQELERLSKKSVVSKLSEFPYKLGGKVTHDTRKRLTDALVEVFMGGDEDRWIIDFIEITLRKGHRGYDQMSEEELLTEAKGHFDSIKGSWEYENHLDLVTELGLAIAKFQAELEGKNV